MSIGKGRVALLLLVSFVLAVVIDARLPSAWQLPSAASLAQTGIFDFTYSHSDSLSTVPVGSAKADIYIQYVNSEGTIYLTLTSKRAGSLWSFSNTKELYTPCGTTPTGNLISNNGEADEIYAGVVNADDTVLADGKAAPVTASFKLYAASYKIWYVVRAVDEPAPVVRDGNTAIPLPQNAPDPS